MIVPGSASQALAAELARLRDEPLARVDYERFPDGEGKVTVALPADGPGDGAAADRPADEAIVVASTVSDRAHVELLQLQDAVREAGVETVTTVIPYMGYARQDRAFEPGEPVSARTVARAVSTGTDRVLTVCPHEESVCDYFDVPAMAVDAADRLAAPLSDDLTDPLFLSPDEGAVDLARSVRDGYGRGAVDYFEKTRLSGDEVEIEPSDAAVDGRDVVVTDDIVATGTTMSEAIGELRARDAATVAVACVHPLLATSARTKLERAGVAGIYGTDTIERDVSAVSVAPAIDAAL